VAQSQLELTILLQTGRDEPSDALLGGRLSNPATPAANLSTTASSASSGMARLTHPYFSALSA
jgi:hypothetical protein